MEYMEYTRSPGGVQVEYMEYTRSLEGVHRESTRTLWSPHGVHSYPWGSVTYREIEMRVYFEKARERGWWFGRKELISDDRTVQI